MSRRKRNRPVPIRPTFLENEVEQAVETANQMYLTPRMRAFVQEYLIDLNGTKAAIRAGYKDTDCAHRAMMLLKDDRIKTAIKKAMDARAARLDITVDRVLQELGRVGFVDVGEFFQENGDLKALNDISRDARKAISSLTVTVEKDNAGNAIGLLKTVKLHSKNKALELIAKHLGILQEKFLIEENRRIEHTHKIDYSNLSEQELQVLMKLVGNDVESDREFPELDHLTQ